MSVQRLPPRMHVVPYQPEDLLNRGVSGISAKILNRRRLTPERLAAILLENVPGRLRETAFPILSQGGAAVPLPELSYPMVDAIAKSALDHPAAKAGYFGMNSDDKVNASLLLVGTAAESPELEECWMRMLSILRFRLRHDVHGILRDGAALSIPLRDMDYEQFEDNHNALRGVAIDYPGTSIIPIYNDEEENEEIETLMRMETPLDNDTL